jgi:hypothetical protein
VKPDNNSNTPVPEWENATKEQREALIKRRIEEGNLYEAPMMEDFRQNGYTQINTSDDLLQLKRIDDNLKSLILKWIPKLDNRYKTQEMLARALILTKSSFDGKTLADLFDSHQSDLFLKWAVANTIACAKVINIEDWLERKSISINMGREYEMLVYAYARFFEYEKATRIITAQFDLFPLQAAGALAKIGQKRELSLLENKIESYKGPQRTEINKAIKKLRKRLSSGQR